MGTLRCKSDHVRADKRNPELMQHLDQNSRQRLSTHLVGLALATFGAFTVSGCATTGPASAVSDQAPAEKSEAVNYTIDSAAWQPAPACMWVKPFTATEAHREPARLAHDSVWAQIAARGYTLAPVDAAKADETCDYVLEGELTDANPHLCNWVGGLQLPAKATAAMQDPKAVGRIKDKLGARGSSRAVGAEIQRQVLKEIIPSIADTIPDVELTASIFFTVFPNWHPWGSFNQINYRFRPNGDNHEECIMECMYFTPIPEEGDYTPVSEIHWLGPDDDYTEASELGMLTKIFNQDLRNLPYVYQGMKATAREHLRFGDYNELKLRHWHELYAKLIQDPITETG